MVFISLNGGEGARCWWCSWLRHWATGWKVSGSIPYGVIAILLWNNLSGRAMVMGSTQPLTEMSTSNIFWVGKGGRCVEMTNLSPHVPIFMKSGSLNILEPSGPVQACIGIGSPICWKKVKTVSFFCSPAVPNQRKEHFLCLKFSRLRWFVLLIGVLRWIWVWNIGGMILKGGTEILGEKHVSVPLCPPWIAHATACDSDTWRQGAQH